MSEATTKLTSWCYAISKRKQLLAVHLAPLSAAWVECFCVLVNGSQQCNEPCRELLARFHLQCLSKALKFASPAAERLSASAGVPIAKQQVVDGVVAWQIILNWYG